MSAIDIAARLAGVPQKTIDEVEAAMPSTAKLLQTFKDHQDLIVQGKLLIDKFGPVVAEAMPLIAQAQTFYAKLAPLIAPAMAEIDAIVPAAQDVVAFAIARKSAPSTTDQQATDTARAMTIE